MGVASKSQLASVRRKGTESTNNSGRVQLGPPCGWQKLLVWHRMFCLIEEQVSIFCTVLLVWTRTRSTLHECNWPYESDWTTTVGGREDSHGLLLSASWVTLREFHPKEHEWSNCLLRTTPSTHSGSAAANSLSSVPVFGVQLSEGRVFFFCARIRSMGSEMLTVSSISNCGSSCPSIGCVREWFHSWLHVWLWL